MPDSLCSPPADHLFLPHVQSIPMYLFVAWSVQLTGCCVQAPHGDTECAVELRCRTLGNVVYCMSSWQFCAYSKQGRKNCNKRGVFLFSVDCKSAQESSHSQRFQRWLKKTEKKEKCFSSMAEAGDRLLCLPDR